ncbi:RNA-guided endonuclease InsQ/TnpB family protein [Streptomyces sp. NPDC020898]|uniref:RNA-guided endonuclease InsQ/TnpB family protein n=1 Tax=Streptomyces sp. NPDC020898 TaxID=3365101 RepID=UPI00379926C3
MSSLTREILHTAALPTPSLGSLQPEQIRGVACIWCGNPLDDSTIDLGLKSGTFMGIVGTWSPKACAECVRAAARRTYPIHITGPVRFRWTKDLPVGKAANTENRITGARLVKDALGWHIAFRIQTLEPRPTPHAGPEVGIDVGVNLPLALSDGNHQDHGRAPRLPGATADRDKWLNPDEKAKLLRLEQRAAHRKSFRTPTERDSKRLRSTYDQIKQLRARATRRAVDWQHQTTTRLARQYGTVVVEALTITNMVTTARGTTEKPGKNVAQKSGLKRSISQEAWGRTVTMLAYKTARQGGTLHKVPAPNTSRRCCACGFITPGSRKDQATFVCKNPDCGWKGNADHNAARNVLHLYRTGHALVPAAGRAVARRTRGVKPTTAR